MARAKLSTLNVSGQGRQLLQPIPKQADKLNLGVSKQRNSINPLTAKQKVKTLCMTAKSLIKTVLFWVKRQFEKGGRDAESDIYQLGFGQPK